MVWAKSHFMCLGQNTANEILREEEKILREVLTINLGSKVILKTYVKSLLKRSGLCLS